MSYSNNDIFKTYPLRLAGYGYGIAESLRGPVGHPWIHIFNSVATGFIFGHTLYRPLVVVAPRTNEPLKIVVAGGDTLLYEIIVSGFVPAFFAGVIRRNVSLILSSAKHVSGPARYWGPSLASLGSLPFIVPVMDRLTDVAMNATIRRLY